VAQAKHVLGLFEEATGLSINYHKTIFLPVAIPDDTAITLATSFGTSVSSFPQTYLGLPLSPHKISVSDCQPLIAAVDSHLSGWSASLLNRAGRLVLSTAVLTSIPLHFMLVMGIPKTVIQSVDRRRRAFFWTGEEKYHGPKCLVAWDTMQLSKSQGRLGVKNLEVQNRCLLMKFVDKLFSDTDSNAPWKEWLLRDATAVEPIPSTGTGFIWRIVNQELNTYRYPPPRCFHLLLV
jgi:hypothetical protein